VAGELVEEGQQQRLAVERPRIVHELDVVSIEALRVGERLLRPHRVGVEAGQDVPLDGQVFLGFEDVPVAAVREGPVGLEVALALVGCGRGEDGFQAHGRRYGFRKSFHGLNPNPDFTRTRDFRPELETFFF
jgi:hypothetical protein